MNSVSVSPVFEIGKEVTITMDLVVSEIIEVGNEVRYGCAWYQLTAWFRRMHYSSIHFRSVGWSGRSRFLNFVRSHRFDAPWPRVTM